MVLNVINKNVMKHIIPILVLVFCSSCQNKKQNKTAVNIEPVTEMTSTFNKEMDSLYNLGVFNGFSAAIVDPNGIVYNKGYGYADVNEKKKYTTETIINIASISKVFIGVALLKAEEMGVLNLDDPINDHLPFKVVNPKYPNEPITIRQLATHTSSILDTDIYMETCYVNKDDIPIDSTLKRYELYYQNSSNKWTSLAEYLPKILKKDGDFYSPSTFSERKPGELREYSNIGAALCALVIEYASHKPFNEFTKDHIFTPLGMTSTCWFFEKSDHTKYSKLYYDNLELPYYQILSYPDGGLITSSTDMSQFLMELINGYSGNGQILNKEGYKTFFKSQLEEKALAGKENFNVGLFIDKELAYNVIGHSGGDPGTNTMMYFNTETKIGKILITNTDSKKENSNAVFWEIWNTMEKY